MTAMQPHPRFPTVSCSQCGRSFGPGNSGFSHCDQHRPRPSVALTLGAEFLEISMRAKAIGFKLVPVDAPACNDWQPGVLR